MVSWFSPTPGLNNGSLRRRRESDSDCEEVDDTTGTEQFDRTPNDEPEFKRRRSDVS